MGFASSFGTIVGGAVFSAALIVASISDIRSRRIPNWLVAFITIAGIAYSLALTPTWSAVARSVMAFGIGFGLWIPFYALRMLGAGDVKMFAAASCWLVPSQVLAAALLSAISGGVLSVVGLVLAHGLGLTTLRIAQGIQTPQVLATPLRVAPGKKTLPYGLAMAIGLLIVGWFPRWIHLS